MRDLFNTDAPVAHNGAPTLRWCLACHGASTRAGCTWCFGLGYEECDLTADEMAATLAQGTVSTAWLRSRARRDREVGES